MAIVDAWPAAPTFSDEPYMEPVPDLEDMDAIELEHYRLTGCWEHEMCEECREQARSDEQYWDDLSTEYYRSIRSGLR